jgi:hypothetical protein
MFNTIQNISRKADKYGDVHFISFLSAVLSRLAYFNDNNFLKKYNDIMGPVIQPKILSSINSVPQNNLSLLLDDQTLFGLNKTPDDIFANFEYQYKGKNYIDFLALNMPQNINIINGDLSGNISYPLPGQQPQPEDVKYISIGWSNYGEIYVVADKRMPNTIFLIFRGTYSAKTAALYSKPTSAVPLTVCKDSAGNPEQFLYGIFKATTEMIHTIIETMRFLATSFLGATTPNSVKIFTTGHSLGGAMCTNFAYLWMGIKNTAPYNSSPYNVLSDNIVCISLGAPRSMSASVANKFCNFVSQKKILFLRITTNGDPVPALPPKNPLFPKAGFEHPCSMNAPMRAIVSEACMPQLTMRPIPNVNYAGNLDCLNYKARIYGANPLSHTIYLDILYIHAVDIMNFIKGIGVQKEVLRTADKSTVCRLVMGINNNYSAIFFDVNKARETPSNLDISIEAELSKVDPNAVNLMGQTGGGFFSSLFSSEPVKPTQPVPQQPIPQQPVPQQPIPQQPVPQQPTSSYIPRRIMPTMPTMPKMPALPKIGGPVAEDRRMTATAFNTLIEQMIPLSDNLCPQQGKTVNPFNNQIMPDLSCPGAKFGGKRNNKSKNKKSKNKKSKNKKSRNKQSRKRRTQRH